MLDEMIARARTVEPPLWDDLREQRLLRGSLDLTRKRLARARQLRSIGVASGALMTIALVIFVLSRHSHVAQRTLAVKQAATSSPSLAASQVSTPTRAEWVQLVDGSRMSVDPDARYRITEQAQNRIRILQLAGRVAYEVMHNPDREFTVQAADVRVQVTGTRFTVNLSEEWVNVHVDAGRVEVNDGSRTTALLAGEDLRVHAWNAAGFKPTSDLPATVPTDSQSPPIAKAVNETAASLLARADKARTAGKVTEAIDLLQSLVKRYPSDSRFPVALFTLGRLRASQGRYAQAASEFARCRHASAGSLAEDALAEEATACKGAGNVAESQGLARQYVEQYPEGTHSKRMRVLLP